MKSSGCLGQTVVAAKAREAAPGLPSRCMTSPAGQEECHDSCFDDYPDRSACVTGDPEAFERQLRVALALAADSQAALDENEQTLRVQRFATWPGALAATQETLSTAKAADSHRGPEDYSSSIPRSSLTSTSECG